MEREPDESEKSPESISRLSVAAAILVPLPWTLLIVGLSVANFFGVADALGIPLALMALICIVASLVMGVMALINHASKPKLSGLAWAIFAVVFSGTELAVILHAYASGFIGPHGRLLRVRGRPVLARARVLAEASIHRPAAVFGSPPPLAECDRAALEKYWTLVACEEYASITAFERLAAALTWHEAPNELVEGARLAAKQETDHAVRCFALASALAGQRIEPCELAIADTSTPRLIALAVESLVDGCLGEATSAAEAALLICGQETTAAVHDTLAVIARDEAEHAELSWAVLEWCLAEGGKQVRVAVERALRVLAARRSLQRLVYRVIPSGFVAPSAAQQIHGMATVAQRAAAWQSTYDATMRRASTLLHCAARRAA